MFPLKSIGLIPAALLLIGCVEQQTTKPQTAEAVQPEPTLSAEEVRARAMGGSYPYPHSKAGFKHGPGRDWPRQQFDPASIGPLAAVTEPMDPYKNSICATAKAATPMDAGPRQDWVAKKTQQLIGGVISSFFGGGGGDDYDPPKPPTVDNPIAGRAGQLFRDNTGELELELAGQMTDGGMLINTSIKDAPGKPTFHTVYLERRDCKRAWPDRYLVYKLWLEWSLSVSWTRTQSNYRNGEMVSQKKTSGGFSKSGEHVLDQGRINLNQPQNLTDYQKGLLANAPPPIWQSLGFNGPEAGVRSIGSVFDQVRPEQLNDEMVAIVHVARPAGERYVTEAMAFQMERSADGLLKFTRL